MLRTLTINLAKCRRFKYADSYYNINKKRQLASGISQAKFVTPAKLVNGLYCFYIVYFEKCLSSKDFLPLESI